MRASPHTTYEDAAQEYRARLRAMIQQPQEASPAPASARGAVELPPGILIQRAEEIADISSRMIPLAQSYLDSADLLIREGIRSHFVDQATVELLLAAELIQITREESGAEFSAATLATHSAALWEAISAADKSLSVIVTQGIPTDASYRVAESATFDEAESALELAVATAVSSISRRVQELRRDIAHDLVAGTPWAEVDQGASLPAKGIAKALASVEAGPAAKILLGVHARIEALTGEDVEGATRGRIREWLLQVKQADKIELFDTPVEGLFDEEELKKAVASAMEGRAATIESLNKASDTIKAFCDRFMVLAVRMRKLEDAIRLGKLIRIPQLLTTMTALQVGLLAAIIQAGRYYIEMGVIGVLQAR